MAVYKSFKIDRYLVRILKNYRSNCSLIKAVNFETYLRNTFALLFTRDFIKNKDIQDCGCISRIIKRFSA